MKRFWSVLCGLVAVMSMVFVAGCKQASGEAEVIYFGNGSMYDLIHHILYDAGISDDSKVFKFKRSDSLPNGRRVFAYKKDSHYFEQELCAWLEDDTIWYYATQEDEIKFKPETQYFDHVLYGLFGGSASKIIKFSEIDLSGFDISEADIMGWFQNQTELEKISWGNKPARPTSTANMFKNCSSLTEIDLSRFDTSNAESFYFMFSGCKNLAKIDVSDFDTSNVKSFTNMFAGCESLTKIDVSGFDTSNATDLSGMFSDCKSLTKIDASGFDTSNITTFTDMFAGCENLTKIDVSGFDTSNATDLSYMFYDCESLTNIDVGSFDTSNVINFVGMFKNCASVQKLDLSSFEITYSENLNLCEMFSRCSSLETIYVKKSTDWIIVAYNEGNYSPFYYQMLGLVEFTEYKNEDSGSGRASSQYSALNMFYNCTKLKGGQGTTYEYINENYDELNWKWGPASGAFARVDGIVSSGRSQMGYFTEKR